MGSVSAAPPGPQEDLLLAVAAFSAAISLLFMCKSVLLFDPASASARSMRDARMVDKVKVGSEELGWDLSRLPSKNAASYIIMALGLLWSMLGAALLVGQRLSSGTEAGDGALGVAMRVFAAACFTIAAFTTHGLGGHLRHGQNSGSAPASPPGGRSPVGLSPREGRKPGGVARRGVGNNDDQDGLYSELSIPSVGGVDSEDSGEIEGTTSREHWRFFQPLRGGPMFIATQAAGWLLFSLALVLMLWGSAEAWLGAAHFLRSWALAAGTTGVAAELVLAVSVLTYNARHATLEDVLSLYSLSALRSAASHAAIIAIMYVPVHLVVAALVSTFLVLPAVHAASMWIGSLTIYFALTGFSGDEHTGRREWGSFQDWIGGEAERVLPSWLGSFSVVAEQGAAFDPNQRYVFAYMPHGLYPLGAAYLPHTPSFRKVVNGVRPATLTASIVFQLPFLRDILMWVGARAVRRTTFVHTLREKNAVLVVPGGQAELVGTYLLTEKPAVAALYTRHYGFVRLAIQEHAALVPVVVLGEATSLHNLISLPRLQRWTYRRLGFPIPFLIGGKAGFLPFPSRAGLKYVIGKPIEPPLLAPGEQPSEEQVAELHDRFYSAAERLWTEHRKDFPGYENIPVVRI